MEKSLKKKSQNRILFSMLSMALFVATVFLMAAPIFAATDETLHNGDKVETRPPNPDQLAAINKMADYLDKMGRKEVGNKLRADFKSGTVYISKIESGANAEINPGALGAGRTMAINEIIINQMGSDRVKASGANVANWALTVFHEYKHMAQWMPMEDSSHETPAWSSTIKECGRWIRKTLNGIAPVGNSTTLAPKERVERLQELRQTLLDLQASFNVLVNELRGKLKTGDLDATYRWQGVPPAGDEQESTGTTNIGILEAYASAQVQAGVQEIDRLIAEAKKAAVETLRTVRIDNEEVTGYFQGDKLVKRHGITTRFVDGNKQAEEEYKDGNLIRARTYNEEKGNLMVESVFCGKGDDAYECQRTEYSWDGSVNFEKRRLSKDAKEQIKTSTGEWF
ncbi:MAG: hypothetical protein HQL26_06880 [Candidatus Omnitrophica bacterium]|nr:hypothetical protein [Candidatus Omnitrophota bacterium]